MRRKIESGEVVFSADERSITRKIYLDTLEGRAVETLWLANEVGTTREAAAEVKELFDGQALFDTPKPTKLIERMLRIADVQSDDIVLDFFAGSATTADALLRANAADGKARRFILVQLAESIDPSTEAGRQGYTDIAQLARERLRRSGRAAQVQAGLAAQDLDVGFRALALDDSSFADVLRIPDETEQTVLAVLADNLKADRSDEDLLFQILTDWGLELSLPIERVTLLDVDVFDVDSGGLIACFVPKFDKDLVRAIAQRRPVRAVFRDSCFATDAERINIEQIFREVSKDTQVKVI
jgi:adenine-specific DNA-methyltransferase